MENNNMNNNALQVFNHETFGNVRVIEQAGEPWFVAKDVCEVLGIKNPTQALNQHVEADEKAIFKIGFGSPANIINESGLYALIMQSRKPQAKAFTKWVRSEVLPSLRKHGGYMIHNPNETNEQLMARAVLVANEALQRTQAELNKANIQMRLDAPKVAFAEQVAGSEDSIHIAVLAKLMKQNGFPVGQNRLFEILREDGWLHKSGAQKNLPTQKSMEAGYMEIKETTNFSLQMSAYFLNKTTLVTGKGQQYFLRKYAVPVSVSN